jgi:hypothetical protein
VQWRGAFWRPAMDSLEEEEVDFQNIPAPPNPNERIIYFNSPPLKIELGDVSIVFSFSMQHSGAS